MSRLYRYSVIFFLPIVMACTNKETTRQQNNSDVDLSPQWTVYSGENLNSSALDFESPVDNRHVASELTRLGARAGGMIYLDMCAIRDGYIDLNRQLVESDEFWYPDVYSKQTADKLMTDFNDFFDRKFSEFWKANNYSYSSADIELWGFSFLLECEKGTRIVANKDVFGEPAGNNIETHFKVLEAYSFVKGLDFQIKKGKGVMSFEDRFTFENMMPLDGILLFTEEPFDGPVDITIEIPVKKVMYLSYLRDLKRDANAELQLVPMTLHAEFTLNNLN